MEWLDFRIDTTHEAVDVLADFLSSLGAEGVQVEDAQEILAILQSPDNLIYADDDFLSKLDSVVHVHAYFVKFDQGVRRNREINLNVAELYDDVPKSFVSVSELEQTIRDRLDEMARYLDIGAGFLGWEIVREEDWADGWKKYYQTTHLTQRLVINPSWINYNPAPGEIVVSLDPGSAFGTGTHETTAMCARLLDQYTQPGGSVLDLGCGSGILAIIAAKLGSARVEAVDIDALAVEVAVQNARINQVEIYCHTGELTDACEERYDLIVANIIADVIRILASDFPARLSPGGLLITSGIIREKLAAVESALLGAGLINIVSLTQNDWCAGLWKNP